MATDNQSMSWELETGQAQVGRVRLDINDNECQPGSWFGAQLEIYRASLKTKMKTVMVKTWVARAASMREGVPRARDTVYPA